MSDYHIPVLLEPILSALTPQAGRKYIDATFGGGGHASQILKTGAKVLGLDHDQDAIDHGQALVEQFPNLTLVKANFTQMATVAKTHGFDSVDGILMDLGVSSWQLDQAERGFSFNKTAPLDMRMDNDLGVKAADLIAALGERELEYLFKRFGDEPRARKIAHEIVKQRKIAPITTTTALADMVMRVYGYQRGKLHPATKVFQALRIAVNDELNSIEITLPVVIDLLKSGGVVAIISFHEGEDRLVKQYFKQESQIGKLSLINQKVIVPDENEIISNPRSRSAKLRLARKN